MAIRGTEKQLNLRHHERPGQGSCLLKEAVAGTHRNYLRLWSELFEIVSLYSLKIYFPHLPKRSGNLILPKLLLKSLLPLNHTSYVLQIEVPFNLNMIFGDCPKHESFLHGQFFKIFCLSVSRYLPFC